MEVTHDTFSMARTTRLAKRKPGMRKHAAELLESLKQALAHAQGERVNGMRITSFHLRKGKWVRRTRTIK